MAKTEILDWMKGIDYEVAFWRSLYKVKFARRWILNDSMLGREIALHNFDAPQFLRSVSSDNPLVLDVGCGMSYYTGNKLDDADLNIRYVDPLAHHYNDILDRYAPQAPRISFGMMEYLSAFYPDGDASLIIIQNALDHSANPLKGIYEALASLHIGGVLYLKHYPNEAEKEAYRGFHKFNIDIEDGHLIIWNKETRYDVSDLLAGFARVEVSRYADPEEVIAVVSKTAQVPEQLLPTGADIAMLSEQLMLQQKDSSRVGIVVKRKIKRTALTAAQYVARYFSPQLKNKLKRLLRPRH